MTDPVQQRIQQLHDFRARSEAMRELTAMGAAAEAPLIRATRAAGNENVLYSLITVLGSVGGLAALDALESLEARPATEAALQDAIRRIRERQAAAGNPAARAETGNSGPRLTPGKEEEFLRAIGDANDWDLKRQTGHFTFYVSQGGGRGQAVHVAFDETDDQGDAVITIFTACGPAEPRIFKSALRANAGMRWAAVALKRVDVDEKLVLTHCLLRRAADAMQIAKTVREIARHGDVIEKALHEADMF